MANSTHPRSDRLPLAATGPAARALAISLLLTIALLLTISPGQARADGDPASDVLTETPVYFPADAGIPAAQQARLLALVSEAQRRGYPLRVALIAHKTDLGSIGALWGIPNRYSEFLGTELSLVFHGTLLVVMPNGYGVDVIGEPDAGAKTQAAADPLIHLAAPGGSGAALAQSAITAIQRITSAAGLQLTVPRASAVKAGPPGGVDVGAWVAFAAGIVVLAAAWAASVRARPVRRRVASVSDGS